MKYKVVIRLFLLLSLLATTLLSCRRELLERETAELCITVRIPELFKTKAGETEISPEEAETVMKQLKIWVFRSSDGFQLGVIQPGQGQHLITDNEDRYFLKIDKEIALAHPDVDVYVMANSVAAGQGYNPGGNNRIATLESLVLKDAYFGIGADGAPTHLGVPADGLPFTAVAKNLKMTGDYPSMTVETVTMERAVSKVRFVVSQLVDLAGPVLSFTLDELSLDPGLIPAEEYLFNDSANPYKIKGNTYVNSRLFFPVPAYSDIAHNHSPQDYDAAKTGLSGQAYEDLVMDGIREGVLTDVGACYLRESDKALSGRIVYTMGGKQHTVPFSMASPGGFARNHSWIVYVYFNGAQMEFSVSWTPWEHGQDFYLSK